MAMIPVIDGINGTMNPSAIKELMENNATAPDIKRVIFNLKTVEDKAERDADGNLVIDEATGKPKRIRTMCTPVLATTIEFVDNTKVSVKNSLNDKIDIENRQMSDGTTVLVATDAAKEAGLVYAIVKRFVGKPDSKGTIVGDGYSRILRELVANAYDEDLENAKNRINKANAKKNHEELQKNAKPKNPSMLETVLALSDAVKLLSAQLEKIQTKLG